MLEEPTRTSNKLTGRDLINVGVFSAIYFVLMLGFSMIGALNPFLILVGYSLAILANGVVVALYLSRVPKLGALTLLMLIVTIFAVLTGQVWYSIIANTLLGLCADLIARVGNFKSPIRNTIAYAVMTLWYVVPMTPVIFNEAGYREYLTTAMGESFANTYLTIFNPMNLIFVTISLFAIGILGAGLGQRLLARHFRRAGIA